MIETRHDDEELGFSKEDEKFLSLVNSEVSVNDEGNLVLPLPFRNGAPVLPDNKREVYYRSKSTLTRLSRDKTKLAQCIAVMGKYIDMKHVEAVSNEDQLPKKVGHAWWIPCFPVTHPKKDKVRIVFDSSAKYRGTCLNDVLITGPDINNKLKDVIIGFRDGAIGFSADVECMFHNFYLRDEDRDYIRFFWYRDNDGSKDIIQYRANVHVFGNSSSPAIAGVGLRIAASGSVTEPVSRFINEQFYVDDGCSATDTAEEAISTLHDSRNALSRFNIRLNKICSSCPEVVDAFPESERGTSATVQLESTSCQTALGLIWDTSRDKLIIRSEIPERPFSRRGVLAIVNSVFDPIGISSPIILEGRHLQRAMLSMTNLDPKDPNYWDEHLPVEYEDTWKSWKESLLGLSGLELSRSYRPYDFGASYSSKIHGFCDASTEGLGYVFYLRSTNDRGESHVSFILGNSKIIPKACPTIPRMELCAALDLAIAAEELADKLRVPDDSVFLYSDSMIVLGYIRNTDKCFSKYVTRRVSLILKRFTSDQWFYINTSENPADVASRRQSIQSLMESKWIPGPDFLRDGVMPEAVSGDIVSCLPETVPDVTALKITSSTPTFIDDLIERCSSLMKLTRVTQTLMNVSRRWIDTTSQRLGKSLAIRGPAAPSEAMLLILRGVQTRHFSSDLSSFVHYSPFIDSSNLMRVGGRLQESDFDYHQKFPILVPNKSPFTELLIRHHHEVVKHQGRCITSASIRSAGYFIIHSSRSIRQIISKCVTCRKLRLPLLEQKMSDLPHDRLENVPPFFNSGMDVFGPYLVSDGLTTRRSTANKKCWAVIFTCLSSRATHIESLPSMDTSSLKNALRRFICIRGPVKRLRSDQGSNFIGAMNEDQSRIVDELNQEMFRHNCSWELTPPKASHFGGVWERQIQTVKKIMNCSLQQLGTRVLTRDDLNTFFQECVCILNNTPLWEASANPNDPLPLTPAMLLNLRSNQSPVGEDFSENDVLAYGKKRWRRVQYLSQQFWSRWRSEYLVTLQKRSKWLKPSRSLQVGDVILLKDAQAKRYQWPIGRVTATKISSDGLVRSVDLATSRGSTIRHLRRPVTELALLVPVDSEEAN